VAEKMEKKESDLKIAELSSKDIEAIRALEKKLGDVCLVAVERKDAIYMLEAKMAPNLWEPVDQVYPAIKGLKVFYSDEDTAKLAKSALKSLLNAKKSEEIQKRPIRIKKIR
jgi:hypothetical protein